jgi:hypothetical protein
MSHSTHPLSNLIPATTRYRHHRRPQSVYADHAQVAQLVQHADVGYVSFTGSVAGGRAVYRAAAASRAHTFIDVGLGMATHPSLICSRHQLIQRPHAERASH